MVPTFTCGLLRSNFSLAIWNLHPPVLRSAFCVLPVTPRRTQNTERRTSSLSCDFRDDFLGDVFRRRFISFELHGVAGAALTHGAELGRISEHLGERYERPDG